VKVPERFSQDGLLKRNGEIGVTDGVKQFAQLPIGVVNKTDQLPYLQDEDKRKNDLVEK
jgi:hypothetical protein